MSNWLDHVKKTMKLHPGKALKDVLKLASKTYKKTTSVVKYAVTGKRARKHRRRSRKSKRGGTRTRKKQKRRSRGKGKRRSRRRRR